MLQQSYNADASLAHVRVATAAGDRRRDHRNQARHPSRSFICMRPPPRSRAATHTSSHATVVGDGGCIFRLYNLYRVAHCPHYSGGRRQAAHNRSRFFFRHCGPKRMRVFFGNKSFTPPFTELSPGWGRVGALRPPTGVAHSADPATWRRTTCQSSK